MGGEIEEAQGPSSFHLRGMVRTFRLFRGLNLLVKVGDSEKEDPAVDGSLPQK